MDTIEFIDDLAAAGITLRVEGESLFADPGNLLTDDQRLAIRAHKLAIMQTLSTLPVDLTNEFPSALRLGTLVVCAKCAHFSHRPTRLPDGFCNAHAEPIWAQVPFMCSTYKKLEKST